MSVKPKVPRSKQLSQDDSNKRVYHLVSVKMIYDKGDGVRERTINVLLETPTMDLNKYHLSQIQKGGIQRVQAENGVDPDMVKDAVILNISTMGYMTEAEFLQQEPQPVAN